MTTRDRIDLRYQLLFLGAFHCGTGLRAGLIDRATARDSKGRLRVPGSSFKGVVRRQCGWLLEQLAGENGRGGFAPALMATIFGSPSSEGSLFWDDAAPVIDPALEEATRGQGNVAAFPPPHRTRVSMSRHTGTAERGRLFSLEHAPEGLIFQGRVHGWVGGPHVGPMGVCAGVPLLVAGLLLVDRMGGARGGGFGRCRVTIPELRVNNLPGDLAPLIRVLYDADLPYAEQPEEPEASAT